MANASKPKFCKGQLVWHDGELKKIFVCRGRKVRFDWRWRWSYEPGQWDLLSKVAPLSAREVGPGWVRKEVKP